MSAAIDLDNYFERIGYEGPASPTPDTLKLLHQKHTENIPFENLNPFLRMEVKLDSESLEQKMVLNNRGGYCFEQNLLLRDNRFSVHHLNGETEKQTLEEPSEIREVLETYFLLSLPKENGLDKKLSQLI